MQEAANFNNMNKYLGLCLLIGILVTSSFCTTGNIKNETAEVEWEKIKDIVIYENSQFYSSFPSVVKNGKDDFIVAFRRAPDRRIFNEKWIY